MHTTEKLVTARKHYFCTSRISDKCLKEIHPKDKYASVTEWNDNNFPTAEKVCMECYKKGEGNV